jgi:hypothetical protein
MDASSAYTSSPTLSATTIDLLRATFDARQHRPSEAMWRGIEALAKCLEQMAEGECEGKFFLSSLDPGVGKTQTVIHFLKALLVSPQHEHVGVVMFLSTKQQIVDVVREACLQPSDFAVLVTDDEKAEQKLNDLGTGEPSSARVLFTTQQRLQLVCRDRSFSEVEKYQFRGLPRQVRIWDERLLPTEEVLVNGHDIGGLFSVLKRVRPDMIGDLDQLRDQLASCTDRDIIEVPDLKRTNDLSLASLLGHMNGHTPDLGKLATDLWSLFGTKVSVRDDGKLGRTMVSIRDCVPPDIAPLVILDASGRVRTAYHWWQQHRETLVRLAEAPKRYNNLVVHVWDIGGGKASFAHEQDLYHRCSGIAKTINRKPTERWLVVCHKNHRKRVEQAIMRELQGDPARVSFIHWGIHRASNDFRDISNVVLAGTQFLSPSSYEGIGRAACGLRPAEGVLEASLLRDLEQGELADVVLQAVCRGDARRAVNDRCPPCHVYIIARPASGVRGLLPDVFPGCVIETWEPGPRRLPRKVREAFDFIVRWFAEHPDELLTIEATMSGIGEDDRSNFNKNIRKHTAFKQHIADAGIYEEWSGRECLGFRQELEEPSFEELFGTGDDATAQQRPSDT